MQSKQGQFFSSRCARRDAHANIASCTGCIAAAMFLRWSHFRNVLKLMYASSARALLVISHFIHLLLSMWFLLLVSTLHTLVVARSGNLWQALLSSRTRTNYCLHSMHKIWIYHESPLFHKPTESQEYIPLFIYKHKDELHLWHSLISIEKQKLNSIEIIVGITYLDSSKTVVRLPPVHLRSVCEGLRPFHVWWRSWHSYRKATSWWTYDHLPSLTYHFSAT